MRKLFSTLTLFAAAMQLRAQEPWREVLSVDPLRANGYFIINPVKAESLGLANLRVDILADRDQGGGQTESRLIESFTLTGGQHFGNMNLHLIAELEADEVWHYEIRGTNELGLPVVDVTTSRTGGGWAWPEVCNQTCVSNQYAWKIAGYSDGGQTFLELVNAVNPVTSSYYYFFVPDAQWAAFKQQNHPYDFGLNWAYWSMYECSASPSCVQATPGVSIQNDVVHFASLAYGSPALNGFSIGGNYVGLSGWAIRKDRGPWRNLHAWTNNLAAPNGVCFNLVEHYNNDALVTANRLSHTPNIPLVTCMAATVVGGGTSWGNNNYHPCETIGYTQFEGDVFEWIQNVADCYGQLGWAEGWGNGTSIHGINIQRWENYGFSHVADAALPTNKDTKLTPFPRIQLERGLYQTTLILEGGHVYRHFESFDSPIILTGDFAAFSDVNIYPVPVTGREFAIDFDLTYAMAVGVHIVNNMGVPHYQTQLNFDLPGLNKHVVTMPQPWANGIYHAVFTYPDGSTDNISFTVEGE